MLSNIFMISLSMSAVILFLLIISPILNKRYSAKWRYFVWLILAVRLIIPFKAQHPSAPVNIPAMQNQTVAFKAEGIPFAIMDESFEGLGNNSPHSADYAPIIAMEGLINIIWALGAICFLFYHISRYIVFKRKIKPYCNKIESEIFDDILNAMQIRVKPQLLQCGKIASPMMIGFIKPTILLPSTNYSNNELAVILKHELTHFKRGDLWYKLLLVIANAVHWFNPLIYLMARQANRDMEYSCDDAVIKDSDISYRKAYSMTILKAMQNDNTTTLSTNFSENGKRAKKRFANILNMKAKKTGIAAIIIVSAFIAAGSMMVVCDNGKQGDLPLLGLQPYSLLFADLHPLMGQSAADFTKNIDMRKARIDKYEYGETYLMRTKINGKECFVSVNFNNNVLIGIRYSFFKNATEAGYDYAKQIRSEISKAYGEPTDNPIILSNTQKRLDDLKSYSEIVHVPKDLLTNYSEDWLLQKDSSLARAPAGYLIRRTDIRIDFICVPNDAAHIEIRYNLRSPESLSAKEVNGLEQ